MIIDQTNLWIHFKSLKLFHINLQVFWKFSNFIHFIFSFCPNIFNTNMCSKNQKKSKINLIVYILPKINFWLSPLNTFAHVNFLKFSHSFDCEIKFSTNFSSSSDLVFFFVNWFIWNISEKKNNWNTKFFNAILFFLWINFKILNNFIP